jgi:hypothetical protein
MTAGMDAAQGHQQTAGQQDMRKDGSGLVARPQLPAEQDRYVRELWKNAVKNRRHQQRAGQQDRRMDQTGSVARGHRQPAGQQETEENESPMETSGDNGSDSTYSKSTESVKVR